VNEASLRQVLAVLGARWGLVVLLAVPVLAASWGYVATIPPAYTATTVVSFAPASGTDPGPFFTRLLPRYEIVATTDQSLSRAERAAGLSEGDLGGAVVVDLPSRTLELVIEVTTRDEEASMAAVESLAQSVAEATQPDPLVTVWRNNEPSVGGDGTPRRQLIALLVGHALAPLPGAALALLLEGIRPRVRLPEDLDAAGVPTLATSRLRGRPTSPDVGVRSSAEERSLHLMVASGLDQLRGTSPGVAPAVRVISVDGPDEDADQVVDDLRRAARDAPGQEGPPRLVATSDAAAGSGQAHVLVVRSGVPRDRVRATVDLVRHRDGHVLGGVLLAP
jgi:capsular polysaccharide biosynthesis protein